MRFRDQQYPIASQEQIRDLPRGFVSPRIGSTQGLVEPDRPGSERYEQQLAEAIACRVDVMSGIWPAWFLHDYGIDAVPEWLTVIIAEEADERGVSHAEAAAELVRMDHPFDLARAVVDYAQSVTMSTDKNGHVQFIDWVRVAHNIEAEALAGLDRSFDPEYEFGQCRPSEVMANRLGQAPGRLMDSMCAYPHPEHPSDPAGHGGAAGGTYKGARVELQGRVSEKAMGEILVGCAAFCLFRVFAFMHTGDECVRGFLVGAS